MGKGNRDELKRKWEMGKRKERAQINKGSGIRERRRWGSLRRRCGEG